MRALMRWRNLAVAAALMVAALPLAGCQGGEEEAAAGPEPAHLEAVEGSDDLYEITLTADAAERLDIHTAAVDRANRGRLVVPYSALVYETDGTTWVYTTRADLTFVRAEVVVESIDGNRALLSEGPPAGTQVVTVGVAELFGAEHGVGAEGGH